MGYYDGNQPNFEMSKTDKVRVNFNYEFLDSKFNVVKETYHIEVPIFENFQEYFVKEMLRRGNDALEALPNPTKQHRYDLLEKLKNSIVKESGSEFKYESGYLNNPISIETEPIGGGFKYVFDRGRKYDRTFNNFMPRWEIVE